MRANIWSGVGRRRSDPNENWSNLRCRGCWIKYFSNGWVTPLQSLVESPFQQLCSIADKKLGTTVCGIHRYKVNTMWRRVKQTTDQRSTSTVSSGTTKMDWCVSKGGEQREEHRWSAVVWKDAVTDGVRGRNIGRLHSENSTRSPKLSFGSLTIDQKPIHQEVASCGGTHPIGQRQPVYLASIRMSSLQPSTPRENPSFSKISAARRNSDLASSILCCANQTVA